MDKKLAISYEDLVSECGFNEREKDFFKLVKRACLQKNLKKNKPVEKKIADEIYRYFQGTDLDWYKYKLRERDSISGGALTLIEDHQVLIKISQRYDAFFTSDNIEMDNDHILGIFCQGGFLKGDQEKSEFFMPLHNGINVLIGDRGSGKSTALNLAGILSPSISVMAEALITSLLNLLKGADESEKTFIRQARKNLRDYDIKEYSCYFVLNGALYCFYTDVVKSIYCIYCLEFGEWNVCGNSDVSNIIPLNIQVLMQGEVNRIAEKQDEYYLNKLVDSFRPEVYHQRKILTGFLNKMGTQFKEFQPRHISLPRKNSKLLSDFVQRRWDDFRLISDKFKIKDYRDSIDLLEKYIGNCRSAQLNYGGAEYIYDLLQQERESLWIIFLNPIVGALSYLIDRFYSIDGMSETKIFAIQNILRNSLDAPYGWEVIANKIEEVKTATIDSSTNYLDIQQDNCISKDDLLKSQIHQIKNFVINRVQYITYLSKAYSSKRVIYNQKIEGLGMTPQNCTDHSIVIRVF